MEKGKSPGIDLSTPLSGEYSSDPLDQAPNRRTRQRAGSVLSGLGAVGLVLGATNGAKADEFIKVAPDGSGGPAIAEIMDESGAPLGTFSLDAGADSEPIDILPLQSQGTALVSVGGSTWSDIFSVDSVAGANALGLGSATQGFCAFSLDEEAGLWSTIEIDASGNCTLKICSVTELTDCEDYPLTETGVQQAQINIGTWSYAVTFSGYEWRVIELGPDANLDGFPDGPATVQASGPLSGGAYDSHMNRFGGPTGEEGIALVLHGGNLGAVEVPTNPANATFTDIGPLGFGPYNMEAYDGNLFIAGAGSWASGKLARYTEGNTPAGTIQSGATINLGNFNPIATGASVGIDSNGEGWLLYTTDVSNPTAVLAHFGPNSNPFALSGATMGFPSNEPGTVFTILQTTPAGDDDDATPPPADLDGDGWTEEDGDCDDADPANFPGNPEVCDGADNDCDGAPGADEADADFDGFMECEGDCDDTIPNVNPGQTEIMGDGVDNDCDPTTPDDPDGDGDGWTVGAGDCDDTDPAVNPGASELTGIPGVDDDCNDISDCPTDASATWESCDVTPLGLTGNFAAASSFGVTVDYDDSSSVADILLGTGMSQGQITIHKDGPVGVVMGGPGVDLGLADTIGQMTLTAVIDGIEIEVTILEEEGDHVGIITTDTHGPLSTQLLESTTATFLAMEDGNGGYDVELLSTNVPGLAEEIEAIENPGDDDDATPDDDDATPPDDDDATPDDDDSAPDDDDATPPDDDDATPPDDDDATPPDDDDATPPDDDDATPPDDDDAADDDAAADDDDSGVKPGCKEGCDQSGESGGTHPFASLLLMLGAVGGAVSRRFHRGNDGPSNLTGPAMINLYRKRVDALALTAASTPVQVAECSRDRIRRLAPTGQYAPAQRKAARRTARAEA